MKRLAATALVALLTLGGCQSSGFLGFLATTGYVDAKTKKLQEDQAAEIAKLQSQMTQIETLRQQVQAQLSSIPKEVLKELSDAINAYLRSQPVQ